ncbi:rab5 GDP/GTP exchange factor isoform X1 [Cydia fagiglandana]|uniref:rab5 GDP/GTP exchange factor isoform X1 n=2 Tax=Cydia fagiglandana TaxID=1458189 RepID=UPI002FEE3ED6
MWFAPNLQRSYKYLTLAKMPSLRIDQSELKCKNGCDYYGNPQWQGYCSECHREQKAKHRRAEKEKAQASTLPRPEHRTPERERGRLAPHSSFSKFEEKRLRQSETLKKANLLKFSVFKKSSTDDHDASEKRVEFKVPTSVFENMKRDFRQRFPELYAQAPNIERDARAMVDKLVHDVIKCSGILSVDELSEKVQRLYQRYMKHMETHYTNVDSEMKEVLMDFVEKHAMTYLHDLPSIVFSPYGTDDERLDRALSERIQQLSWVGEKQLECRLAEPAKCRQLLYRAINELLGMDSAPSPGGKLARVRRCCRHVLALCGAPASADDLLPALIFTVLKANPPRLVSNINFVTRFCNAQRLMTGEGGYYFTNLCCAVSFIENLTAESLNMDKKEFDGYMAMPASIGGSSWAAALSLSAELREAEEHMALAKKLLAQAQEIERGADELAANAETFEKEIAKKVQDVLTKTPLEIKPRRTLPKFGNFKTLNSEPLVDLEIPSPPQDNITEETKTEAEDLKQDTKDVLDGTSEQPKQEFVQPFIQTEQASNSEIEPREKLNILGFEELNSPPKSPHLDQTWDLKQTSSMELLTPSPLGFTPFDSRSIDELMTPDEFGSEHLAPGLSNINYDIDLSDFSGDNSIAEDAPKEKDPFSPEMKKDTFDPFAARDPFSPVQEMFDQFTLLDSKNKPSDPFEIIPKKDPFAPVTAKDPFSPVVSTVTKDPFSAGKDPFSPVVSTSVNKDPFNPLVSATKDPFSPSVSAAKDPFSPPVSSQTKDPFSPGVSSQTKDPFSPGVSSQTKDPFRPDHNASILDDGDSPTAACLLPSPLLPQSSGKK